MTYTDLKHEYKIATSGDRWADSMCLWFDIAGELFNRGDNIPRHWDYSPGLGGGIDPDSYFAAIVADCESDDLLRFGNVLERYTRNLNRAGFSY